MMVVAYYVSADKYVQYGVALEEGFEFEALSVHNGQVLIQAFPDLESAEAWLDSRFHVKPANPVHGGVTGIKTNGR